jgi:hypothetical protein
VAGLVGVITHDRAAGLAEPELPALVGAYTALRGHTDVEHFSAGRWAAFALIADEAYDDPPIASITSNGDSLTYAQPQISRAQRIQKHLLDAWLKRTASLR